MAEMVRLFSGFMKDLRKLVVDEDAFGLKPDRLTLNAGIWSLLTDSNKLNTFNVWLRSKIVDLERAGLTATGKFSRAAFTKGVERAVSGSRRLASGINAATRRALFSSVLINPEVAERMALIHARAYSLLQGITGAMEKKIQRIIADGFGHKLNLGEITQQLVEEVKLSTHRAKTLARTEIVYAHAEGQLDQFERQGEDVELLAEWSTAGDDRVCDQCAPLEGVVMTVHEARGILPRHPNCRCTWVAAHPDRREAHQKRRHSSIRRAIMKSRQAEGKGTFANKALHATRKRGSR